MSYSLAWEEKKVIESFKSNSKHICVYCGKQLNKETLSVDHSQPRSRRGATRKENLALCCKKCNQEKSDLNKEEYLVYLNIKNNILNDSFTYKTFKNLIKSYDEIIDIYYESDNKLKQLNKEKKQLLDIIKDTKANASEGYKLFKDLQNMLIDIDNSLKIYKESGKSLKFAKENKQKTLVEMNNFVFKTMNDIRQDLNMGKLGELGIEKVDFSKYKEYIREV